MARTTGARVKARPGTAQRSKAWQAMRILRRFTQQQIEMSAEIGESNLQRYIRALVATGYLRIEVARSLGKVASFNVYRLTRDTGPKTPIIGADGAVFDENLKRLFYPGPDGPKTQGVRDMTDLKRMMDQRRSENVRLYLLLVTNLRDPKSIYTDEMLPVIQSCYTGATTEEVHLALMYLEQFDLVQVVRETPDRWSVTLTGRGIDVLAEVIDLPPGITRSRLTVARVQDFMATGEYSEREPA